MSAIGISSPAGEFGFSVVASDFSVAGDFSVAADFSVVSSGVATPGLTRAKAQATQRPSPSN